MSEQEEVQSKCRAVEFVWGTCKVGQVGERREETEHNNIYVWRDQNERHYFV